MKIQDATLSGINLTTTGSQQAGKVQSAERVNGKAGVAATGAGDAVQLSNLSREVEALQADPARAERLERLQAAVNDGTYQPDSAQLSKALVDQAFEE
ncbi:MAG: flagellar biosynthesis anti-sigma factor FlgM [Bryobacteraceae bacterium]|nr:flagellar biosynthesis anti-sigma factor FlgM [Bryobacteraceae bacterium]